MFKERKRIDEVISKEKYCDECNRYIMEYGREWIEMEHHIGAWKDIPEEIKTYHFCNDLCLSKFLKNNAFIKRR